MKVADNGIERDATPEEIAEIEARSVVDVGALKAALIASVDDTIAAICARWLRFEAGYVKREAAARAFVADAYVGDPGIWVTAFSSAAGMTDADASDLIIVQADGLRVALENLEALRMTKYGIQAAVDAISAQAAHDSIIAQANAIAGAL
jgi:hypothetical protein